MALSGTAPTTLRRAVEERGRASRPRPARVRAFTRAALVGGALVVALGTVVLVGWALGETALTRVVPGMVTMKPVTATSLVAVGVSILAAAVSVLTGARWADRVAILAVGLVSAVSLATLFEDVTGLGVIVDNPFGLDPGDASTPVPGRMAQLTAESLVVLSVAIVLTVRRAMRAAQVLAGLVVALGLMALIGYVYGVESMYRVGPSSSIAVPTAAALVVAGVAVLCLRAGEGYLSVLLGNTAGGVILRRLLPWSVLAPNVVGGLIVIGLRHDLFDGPGALATFVTIMAGAGALLVWVQGTHLRDVDLRRGGAEDALAVVQDALAERDRFAGELAASERRTRRILSTAADAYIAIDARGRVTDWNDAATKVFGWTRGEAVGQLVEALIIPPETVPDHRAGLEHYLRTGEGPILGTRLEVEAVDRTGRRVPIELTIWAMGDPADQGFHAFLRDITARKRAEQDLRTANADLTEFAAVAAHDLRSPLSTILMQVDLVTHEMDEGAADAEVRAWVTRIGRTAERAIALIDDLLSYTSIGRGAQVRRPVDLAALARQVVDEQTSSGTRPGRFAFGTLPVVEGDEALLRQLLANLVGNALKYVPDDRTPAVLVDAIGGPDPGHCVLRVSDNGDGFAPDEQERLFEMFQRGRAAAGLPGTGIGLAICRRVAELHGGRIWVEPRPGGGCRLCVRLPLAPCPEAEGPSQN